MQGRRAGPDGEDALAVAEAQHEVLEDDWFGSITRFGVPGPIRFNQFEVGSASGVTHAPDPYKFAREQAEAKYWADRGIDINESVNENLARRAAERRQQEIRVTDPVTGGQKGSKLAQLGALCPKALMKVAEVAGFGSSKYERFNFLKGYRWSLSYDAMQRHLHAWWGGEDEDDESGLSHLAHATWHGLALLAFTIRGLGTDDRPT